MSFGAFSQRAVDAYAAHVSQEGRPLEHLDVNIEGSPGHQHSP